MLSLGISRFLCTPSLSCFFLFFLSRIWGFFSFFFYLLSPFVWAMHLVIPACCSLRSFLAYSQSSAMLCAFPLFPSSSKQKSGAPMCFSFIYERHSQDTFESIGPGLAWYFVRFHFLLSYPFDEVMKCSLMSLSWSVDIIMSTL